MKKICVLGLGYIGLPTALILAKNYDVVGIDINENIVNKLNKGILPFSEHGLSKLWNKTKKNFIASTKMDYADVFLISVPTPIEKTMKIANLKYVKLASEMISKYLKDDNLVILESTVPPGASENIVIPILNQSKKNYEYAYCPERAIPGKTIYEIINNDRIIGGSKNAKKIYESFVKGNIYLTNIKTAEFVKIIENTYRDVNIALANELALISKDIKLNIWESIEIANKHPRVNIHKPGPGVGGHCISIDPLFLLGNSVKCRLISLSRDINDLMPNHLLQLTKETLLNIKKPTITIFGVAYKGNIDDTRETPSLKFIKLAENEGFNIKIYDPYVKKFEYKILNIEESVKNSDCIIIITDHKKFEEIDPYKISTLMRRKNVIDARNILKHDKWKNAGFSVKVFGRFDI